MAETAEKEAHAHDQQQVGQNGTQHRRLHDLDLAILERDDTNLSTG